ncbi:MAG: hypothetical protein ACKVRP_06525 [Bacteroidota bacterium]
MIYINRDGHNPELNWVTRADQVTNQLLNANTVAARSAIIDANEVLWGELKGFLLTISNEKCWYSEAKDKYSHLHVDHFRPKKVAIGIDKKDYGGYWWLAFQWKNYRVCGGAGNVRKKDKFAVRANKANSPQAVIEDEMIYFLDPTDEEDPLKITFNGNGEVTPIEKAGWDFERAQYTITSLNLNFKPLKEARKKLWNDCSTLVKETQDLMQQNNQNPSAHRKGQIKEKLKRIKVLVEESAEFSATAKACLRSTALEWAMSIAA